MKRIVLSAMLLSCGVSQASEIVYTPTNPTFGGNPLNGSFLLGKAQAQNEFAQEAATAANRFEQRLENAILSQLSRRIVDAAFGSGDLAALGSLAPFIAGDFQVEIDVNDNNTIIVTITNLLSGEVTIIEVPVQTNP